MFLSLEIKYQPVKGVVIHPLRLALVASLNMASISVNIGNWTLECAAEIYIIKQTLLSKDYDLYLSKENYHRLVF